MAPTSDERREVAARLREDASCSERSTRFVVESYLGIEYDGTDMLEESYKSESLLHLADLIDPTCTVESVRIHTGSFGCEEAGYEYTLSCGHTVIVDGDFPPSYCDECGARVVGDDD
jgi:hypothetical protein